jgi:hypothetical protein
MAYTDLKALSGAEPEEFVELEMDICSLTYGLNPCVAALGSTGDRKCFNTYATCQDKQNFDRSTYTYRFAKQNAALPIGINAIPLLQSVSYAAQQITPGKGLGVRGSVTLKFLDAPFVDDAFDKYANDRGYDSLTKGTFWGKFKARHKFFQGRLLKLKTGYLTKPFSWDNFQERIYIIESMTGPDSKGMVTVVAKDILKLADDDRAQCPKPNRGKLFADIDAIQTTLTLTPLGIGNEEYPANGIIRVGSEIMTFSRAADVLTVVRNQYNSVAAEHKANDAVQLCAVFTSEPVQNIIYTLLTNYANLPTAYIDKTAWDLEQSSYLPGVYSAIITEPTGVNKLIAELTEQGLCYLWWDEVAKLVQFRALRPPQNNLPMFTDENGFIADSLSLKELSNERVSRFLVYFDRKDLTKKLDETANYNQYVLGADLESESANEHGSSRIKTIYSRWFNANSLGRVEILAQTLLKKYTNPPRVLEFVIDNKEDLSMGDLFIAQTRLIQNDVGDNDLVNMQVVERIEKMAAHHIKITAQENIYNARANDFNNRRVIISFDTLDLNLYDAYVSEYGVPPADVLIEFEILTGVLVSASTTANYALTVDDRWPSGVTIILINNGIIAGRGANGVKGVDILDNIPLTFSAPLNGNNGGDALLVDCLVEIDNTSGVITGGGPSGGSGGAYYRNSPLPSGGVAGSGSGGGWPLGLGGGKGVSLVVNAVDGLDGGSAATLAGTGGAGALNGIFTGGKGGDGGKYIDAQNGSSAIGPGGGLASGIGNGGILGDAIHGNSLITWVNTGTIYGNIVP